MGPNATARTATPATAKRVGGSGFSIDEQEAPRGTAPAPALRTVGGIDALMALQGDEQPTERRRRAVTRGRVALDALDGLKIELLAGTPGPSTLQRLQSVTAGLRDSSGDATLDAVLAEIELRVEVELAKVTPPKTSP